MSKLIPLRVLTYVSFSTELVVMRSSPILLKKKKVVVVVWGLNYK